MSNTCRQQGTVKKLRIRLFWIILALLMLGLPGWWYWCLRREYFLLKGHMAPVTCLIFSPDGGILASGDKDGMIKLWDVAGRMDVGNLEGHLDAVKTLAFAPHGTVLASGSEDKTAKLWDVPRRTELATLAAHKGGVLTVAFGIDGLTLVSEAHGDSLKIWDLVSRQVHGTVSGHKGYDTSGLVLDPRGRFCATVGFLEKTPNLWDLVTGQKQGAFKGNQKNYTFYSIAISPDGKSLATGTWQWDTLVWDVDNKRERLALGRQWSTIVSVGFSPDSRILATAEGPTEFYKPYPRVTLWDVATGRELASMPGTIDGFSAVAFSPDGKLLAAGSFDNTIRIWVVSRVLPVDADASRG